MKKKMRMLTVGDVDKVMARVASRPHVFPTLEHVKKTRVAHMAFHRERGSSQDAESMFREDVATAFSDILNSMSGCFGLDVKDKNFVGTPARVGRAYCEILSGLMHREQRVQSILATTFPGKADQMVVVGPVHVWSFCAHHFLPVEMGIWVGYIPNGKVLGLSKLARLAEIMAKRPGLQEDVTTDIAETLFKHLKPKGSACLIRGRHLCMEMRGVKQGSITTSTSLFGAFRKQATREEFLRSTDGSRTLASYF